MIPLALKLFIFFNYRLIHCSHFFLILCFLKLFQIVFFYGLNFLLFLLLFQLNLNVRLSQLAFTFL